MGSKLYVGNLSFDLGPEALEAMFHDFGRVRSVHIISDRDTGQSKGFGFVEMSSDEEAQAAIEALDGKECDGRPIKVNEAKPQEKRGGRGGHGGRGGRGGDRRY